VSKLFRKLAILELRCVVQNGTWQSEASGVIKFAEMLRKFEVF